MAALAVAAAAAPPRTSDALSRLAQGIAAFDEEKYAEAVQNLKGLAGRIPALADYAAYYLAAARLENKDNGVKPGELEPVRAVRVKSPLLAKSRVLEARALLACGRPQEGVRLLRGHYAELPQPDGDLALAMCYEGVPDPAQAVAMYQQIYYCYPRSDAAVRAEAALLTWKDTMGANYPEPAGKLRLERANRLLAARDYGRARAEFQTLAAQLSGEERDAARVGAGVAEFLNGSGSSGYLYLRNLELAESEADARRWYYVEEGARRRGDDAQMEEALKRLERSYPKSPWRHKALTAAASRYLVSNQPAKYIPLYRAVYEDFPAEPQAAASHWKVAWEAYIGRRREAGEELRRHLVKFPFHNTSSAALYFLGRLAERDRKWNEARAYYSRLVELYPNYYYGTLARERMAQTQIAGAAGPAEAPAFLEGVGFRPRTGKEPAQPSPASLARIERARLLREAGLEDLAEAELRFGAKTDGQPRLLALELARHGDSAFERLRLMKSVSVDYLSLNLDEADRRFWEHLFPLPYQADLVRNARAQGLDPFMVAALVRQESEFNPKAVSSAKAYGLTQVRPSTGRQIARRVGIRRFSTRMLFQPATNLKLGTYYMRSLLDNWGGKWEETLASYNAGPNRAKEWITWHEYQEPAEFVESIPFTETREYVQAVMRNAAMYRQIYGNRPPLAEAGRKPVAKSAKASPKKTVKRGRDAPKKTARKR
ncbi:MAG: transglycosylase SLT domain-containing protein [Bryobacteraceae bacterium]